MKHTELPTDVSFADLFLEQRDLDTDSEEWDAGSRADRFQEAEDPSGQDDASPYQGMYR